MSTQRAVSGIVCARACTAVLRVITQVTVVHAHAQTRLFGANIEDTVHAARGVANKVQRGGGQRKHHMQWHPPQEMG